MQKLFFICLFICLSPFAVSDSIAQTIDLTVGTKSNQVPRLQAGKQVKNLQVPSSFNLDTLAGNLGRISAIAYDNKTRYFVADKQNGQIWQLTDRNKDGRIDIKRALAHRFDAPSGIAVNEDKIFIADRNAVWVIDNLQPPQKLAGLRNANSIGERHRLSLSSDKTSLRLSLTTSDQVVKVLSIDIKTGQAELLNKLSTQENFVDFGHISQNVPWVILGNSFGPDLSDRIKINASHRLYGGAIPNFTNAPQNIFNNHIYLSRHSSEGFDVLAAPINLGRIKGHSKKVLSGFLSQTKRSAWGAPGLLLFDSHGLIIADSFNGDLYRLRPKPANPKDLEENVIVDFKEHEDIKKDTNPKIPVSTLEGSQIVRGSTLERASDLLTGSNLNKNYKSLASEIQKSQGEEKGK